MQAFVLFCFRFVSFSRDLPILVLPTYLKIDIIKSRKLPVWTVLPHRKFSYSIYGFFAASLCRDFFAVGVVETL